MALFDRVKDRLGFAKQNTKNIRAFDAGKNNRRLKSIPTSQASINAQIRSYGPTVLARSRYLATNNPHAASAKECFMSSLVGDGIKPSTLIPDPALKAQIQTVFNDWTNVADSDNLTDWYGLQAIIAAEIFEAGECFVRIRRRLPQDGFIVPFQLQLLPAEMLDVGFNKILPNGNYVESGIEFNKIGQRINYHFWKSHPNTDQRQEQGRTIVPAEDVYHLFKPIRAGQIRGIPHTVPGMVTLAMLDRYEDAELERKATSALFTGFITRPEVTNDDHPLESIDGTDTNGNVSLEPGAMVDLGPGEDVTFAKPEDSPFYEQFLYRQLLKAASGFGVPYSSMTGDLRQTSYGSIRAGLIEFRRRISAMQNHIMIHQFCRPIWEMWIKEAVLAQAINISPSAFAASPADFLRVKFITPKWEWIDPLKDRQAEKLAVDNGFKARSDVIEAEGYDPEEVDMRIALDREREANLNLKFNDVQNIGQDSTDGMDQADQPDQNLTSGN